MEVKELIINNPHGLHLRTAATLIQKCKDYKSKIIVRKGCSEAEVNSILQLLLLGAQRGSEIRIVAQGEDEKQAVQDIAEFLQDGAGI